jgi:hypothetical protein
MRRDRRRRPVVVLAGAALLLLSASPAFAQLGGSGSLTDTVQDTSRDLLDTTEDTLDDGLDTVDDAVDDVTSTVEDLVGGVTDELLEDAPDLDGLSDLDDGILDDEDAVEEDELDDEVAPAAPRDASGLRAWLDQDHGIGGVPYDPNVVRAIAVHEREEDGAVAIAGDPSAAVTEQPAARFGLAVLIVLLAGAVGLRLGRSLSGTRAS